MPPQENRHNKQSERKRTGPVSKLPHSRVATLKILISVFVAENRNSIPLQLPESVEVSSEGVVLHAGSHVVARAQKKP